MFFAFILLLIVNAVSLSTILFQCATTKRSNQQRKSQKNKSQKSTRSRKSSKSSRSGKSGRSSSTRSGKSGKSSRSGKSKSGKSYKLKLNPKGTSNKKVQAAILADQKAAQDAINPSLKELVSDKQMLHSPSSSSSKKEPTHKVSYANVRVIPHEMSFPSTGGLKHVRVKNSSGKRIAFMVKCSDNMLFSINPVFGIIETDRDAQINILRENGEAKHDKMVIITAAHSDKNKSAEQTFSDLHLTNSHNYNINVVPLLTQ